MTPELGLVNNHPAHLERIDGESPYRNNLGDASAPASV